MTVGTPIYGPISDCTGRKPAIFAGCFFISAGSLLSLLAASFQMLIFGRFIQGFGAAGPRIVAMAMVRDPRVARHGAHHVLRHGGVHPGADPRPPSASLLFAHVGG